MKATMCHERTLAIKLSWVYLKYMVIDYYFLPRHNEDILIKN